MALCGGAGAFLLPKAIRSGADVFITGEIKYHDYFGHEEDILMHERACDKHRVLNGILPFAGKGDYLFQG